jgi:hypothetical protein
MVSSRIAKNAAFYKTAKSISRQAWNLAGKTQFNRLVMAQGDFRRKNFLPAAGL